MAAEEVCPLHCANNGVRIALSRQSAQSKDIIISENSRYNNLCFPGMRQFGIHHNSRDASVAIVESLVLSIALISAERVSYSDCIPNLLATILALSRKAFNASSPLMRRIFSSLSSILDRLLSVDFFPFYNKFAAKLEKIFYF